MTRLRGRDNEYLPALVIQLTGLILLIAFAIFWAATGRESALLVGAAGSLILLGGFEHARQVYLGNGNGKNPDE